MKGSCTTRRIGSIQVSEFRHPPGRSLPKHRHKGSVICIPLRGAYDETIHGKTLNAARGQMISKPPSVLHSDRFGAEGCTLILLEVEPGAAFPHGEVLMTAFLEPRLVWSPRAATAAWTLGRELRTPDPMAELAVEALALELIVEAMRRSRSDDSEVPPPWLSEVDALLREDFRGTISLTAMARVAGVSSGHLARTFRRFRGCSVGEFVRSLRLEWAVHRLTSTDDPVAMIATQAGFYDQSHFGRALRGATGRTPLEFRRGGEPVDCELCLRASREGKETGPGR
jgi:AraC family transcriptional regulator